MKLEKVPDAYNRRLARAFLDFWLLSLIVQKPRWGYEVISELRARFGFSMGVSSVYSVLYFLENEGYITGEWESFDGRQRRIYKISANGIKALQIGKSSFVNALKKFEGG